MPRYIAIIDEEDGMYGAFFPDAPGCTAMGETEEEAIDNAFEALEEWARNMVADGQEVPKPAG
jgi:predicted RNase H-like HicB family nuclease